MLTPSGWKVAYMEKSTKVNGKEKPIFIIQKEDFPELWSGINCFMKTANGIPTYLFNHLLKNISQINTDY